MFTYGKRSQRVLTTLHPDLQEIYLKAIMFYDISLLEGHRDKETQNSYFDRGLSKIKWPDGKHNTMPSLACDSCIYSKKHRGPDWNDMESFKALAFFLQGIAAGNGIKLRVGVDWNGNMKSDQSFVDGPHVELVSKMINGKEVFYE